MNFLRRCITKSKPILGDYEVIPPQIVGFYSGFFCIFVKWGLSIDGMTGVESHILLAAIHAGVVNVFGISIIVTYLLTTFIVRYSWSFCLLLRKHSDL